jgi:hypothetical protein
MIDPTKKDQLAKVDKILSPTPTPPTVPIAMEKKQTDLTPAEKLKMLQEGRVPVYAEW